MADPAQRDPAEGGRKTVERQLKNPEQEAENPGGRPTPAVQGSAPGATNEPQGQQGSTMPKGH